MNKYLEKVAAMTALETGTLGAAAGAASAPKDYRGSGAANGAVGGLVGGAVGSALGSRVRLPGVGAVIGSAAAGGTFGKYRAEKKKQNYEDKLDAEIKRRQAALANK